MSMLPLEPTPLPPAPKYWALEETNSERLHAIAAFGFTDRQSRFLMVGSYQGGVVRTRTLTIDCWRSAMAMNGD